MTTSLPSPQISRPGKFSLPVSRASNSLRYAAFFVLFGLLWILTAATLQAQSFAWATRTTNAYSKSNVSSDNSGNTYVTANFTGTITLGAYTLTSRGSDDICIVKYNSAGAVQWARRIGSTGDDQSGDIAVSTYNDKVYITGSFRSTVLFGSYHGLDVSPLTSAGSSDIFVAEYIASTGTLTWARRAGGSSEDTGMGIALDASDNVFITGYFKNGASFNSGGSPTHVVIGAGEWDIFMAKYNSSGTIQFARPLGGVGFDYGAAIAIDRYTDDIYLTGSQAPATNPYIANVIVAKYNAAGILQWARTAGMGTYIDNGEDIIVTASGVYVIGSFGNTINFGGTVLTSGGSSDIFLVKYTLSGNVDWAKNFGGPNWDEGQGIAEKFGDYYILGTFNGTATFGHNTISAVGGATDRDMFVARIFSDGTPIWTQRVGSAGYDYGRGGITSPSYNSLYFTGHYGSSITLGSTTLSGSGNLLAKLVPPTLPYITGFRLINADTEADLGAIPGFSDINYMLIGTNRINIKVNTDPATIGSVRFNLDGTIRTENYAPYAYAGDNTSGGVTDYNAFTPSLGNHRLEVTPYSGPDGTGVRGQTRILFFKVVNQPVVTSLTLINANTNAAIGSLTSGQTINLSTIGTNQLNIRANTNPATIGSVRFNLDGTLRTENNPPYAYAGDNTAGGVTDYNAFTPSTGYHHLVVTPYTGSGATGTTGEPYDIYFYVVSGKSGREGKPDESSGAAEQVEQLSVAPNPFAERTTVSFHPRESGLATLEIYNTKGQLVKRLYEGQVESGQRYSFEFTADQLPAGMYISRVTAAHKVFNKKMILTK